MATSVSPFSATQVLAQLIAAVEQPGGTDIHISPGSPPACRVQCTLAPVITGTESRPLTDDETSALIAELMPERLQDSWKQQSAVEVAYVPQGGSSRFRCHIQRVQGGWSLAMRRLSNTVIPYAQLGLPDLLEGFARRGKGDGGLLVFSGKTGSGKSTSAASFLTQLVQRQPIHLVTVEGPIEYLIGKGDSIVNQMELGDHVVSVTAALENVLRYDPDVVFIGELRGLRKNEVFALLLELANTGLPIVTTMHAESAPDTLVRIVQSFPGQETQIREMLANHLLGVCCQQLAQRADQNGLVAVAEVLWNVQAVHDALLPAEDDKEDLRQKLERTIRYETVQRCQAMERRLLEMVTKKLIAPSEALRLVPRAKLQWLDQKLNPGRYGTPTGPKGEVKSASMHGPPPVEEASPAEANRWATQRLAEMESRSPGT